MGNERLDREANRLRAKLERADKLSGEEFYYTLHRAKQVAKQLKKTRRNYRG